MDQSGHDLSLDQWMVLTPIWKNNGIVQHEIVRKCGKDKTSVTRIISTLENKNLVLRVKDQVDQRVNHIHLTKKGDSLFEKITPLMEQMRTHMKKNIPQKDCDTMRSVLLIIIGKLDSDNS